MKGPLDYTAAISLEEKQTISVKKKAAEKDGALLLQQALGEVQGQLRAKHGPELALEGRGRRAGVRAPGAFSGQQGKVTSNTRGAISGLRSPAPQPQHRGEQTAKAHRQGWEGFLSTHPGPRLPFFLADSDPRPSPPPFRRKGPRPLMVPHEPRTGRRTPSTHRERPPERQRAASLPSSLSKGHGARHTGVSAGDAEPGQGLGPCRAWGAGIHFSPTYPLTSPQPMWGRSKVRKGEVHLLLPHRGSLPTCGMQQSQASVAVPCRLP